MKVDNSDQMAVAVTISIATNMNIELNVKRKCVCLFEFALLSREQEISTVALICHSIR